MSHASSYLLGLDIAGGVIGDQTLPDNAVTS